MLKHKKLRASYILYSHFHLLWVVPESDLNKHVHSNSEAENMLIKYLLVPKTNLNHVMNQPTAPTTRAFQVAPCQDIILVTVNLCEVEVSVGRDRVPVIHWLLHTTNLRNSKTAVWRQNRSITNRSCC